MIKASEVRTQEITTPPESRFMAIHEAAAGTHIPDRFIFKPQPNSESQERARQISSRIWRVKWGSK